MAKDDETKKPPPDFTLAAARPGGGEAPKVFSFKSSARSQITRRAFLRSGIATGAGVVGGSVLPGCGGGDDDTDKNSFYNETSQYENRRDVLVRSSHKGEVNAVAVNTTGDCIVSGGSDRIAKVWSADGRLRQQYRGHGASVEAVACSGNDLIASGCTDGVVHVWEAATGALVRRYEEHRSAITGLAFSPDGEIIVSASRDGTAHLWEVVGDGGPLVVYRGHQGPVNSVAFHPTGMLIQSGSDDETAHIWDRDGECIAIHVGHGTAVTAVTFVDGERAASGGADGVIHIWHAANGETLLVFGSGGSRINGLSASPDGTLVAVAGSDATVRVWSTVDGVPQAVFTGHEGPVNTVVFCPGGDDVLSGSDDHTLQLWDGMTAVLIRLFVDEALTEADPNGTGMLVCTCDTVRVCSCDTVRLCTCNSVCTCDSVCGCDSQGGGHYWYPN